MNVKCYPRGWSVKRGNRTTCRVCGDLDASFTCFARFVYAGRRAAVGPACRAGTFAARSMQNERLSLRAHVRQYRLSECPSPLVATCRPEVKRECPARQAGPTWQAALVHRSPHTNRDCTDCLVRDKLNENDSRNIHFTLSPNDHCEWREAPRHCDSITELD